MEFVAVESHQTPDRHFQRHLQQRLCRSAVSAGEILQVLAHQRIHRRTGFQGANPRPFEQLVVDRNCQLATYPV